LAGDGGDDMKICLFLPSFLPNIGGLEKAADILALLEALSYGKPVLGAASPGLVEILHDQVNGVLVPPDDPAQLAEGVQRMLQADLKRLGAGAHQTARDHSWEGCADRYAALFQEVVDARRKRPAARDA
jgi:glycosyltransferase involved in cell wall biosynthesis